MDTARDLRILRLWLMAASTVVVMLVGLVVLLLVSRGRAGTEQEQVLAALVAASPGIFDTFPDADVGRTLQPGLEDRDYRVARVRTNRFGMREREYALPKPDGLVRVVLLGDSYVFGWDVQVEQRAGHLLERELQARGADPDRPVEVLHLGVPTWNLISSSAWLRRQLDLLAPDLVIHVAVPNDLADDSGVRGFGANALMSDQHRERADGVLFLGFGHLTFGDRWKGLLAFGLDHESRSRFAASRAALADLRRAVEATGARYRLLVNFGSLITVAREHLVAGLPEPSLIWLPARFTTDTEHIIERGDPHWNAAGHAVVARLLYGIIHAQDLLPELGLSDWDEASAAVADFHDEGRQQSRLEPGDAELLGARNVTDALRFEPALQAGGFQVHGGIDAQGRVSPYASLVLRNEGAGTLRVAGTALDRSLAPGARLRLFVDELELSAVALQRGRPFDVSLPLPDAVRERPYLSIRMQADDYVYAPEDLRHCIAAQLTSVELVP